MDKKDRSREMVIITESACWDGSGSEEGKTIFNLVMVCIAGIDKGKELDKRYVLKDELPEYLQQDMLRLGYRVNTVKKLEEISEQLTGVVVRVSLMKDGDTLLVYIDDYFGRDDPKKYAANR